MTILGGTLALIQLRADILKERGCKDELSFKLDAQQSKKYVIPVMFYNDSTYIFVI